MICCSISTENIFPEYKYVFKKVCTFNIVIAIFSWHHFFVFRVKYICLNHINWIWNIDIVWHLMYIVCTHWFQLYLTVHFHLVSTLPHCTPLYGPLDCHCSPLYANVHDRSALYLCTFDLIRLSWVLSVKPQ